MPRTFVRNMMRIDRMLAVSAARSRQVLLQNLQSPMKFVNS
jgi:hypothetical protein